MGTSLDSGFGDPIEGSMNEHGMSPVAAIAAAGAAAGLLGALTGRRRLALAAGLAGAAGVWLATKARTEQDHLEDRVSSMDDQIRQLENAVAAQVQGRMAAEEAVRSLTGQLSDAEKRAGKTSSSPIVLTEPDHAAGGLTDPITGLFNHEYFLVSLDSRIAAARRHLRPVAVAILHVVRGREGENRPAADAGMVAAAIRETLRESDTATRLNDGRYGIVLEDTPENGAIWTIERVRRRLAQEEPDITMWAGVSCYPAHAFDVPALIDRAEDAMTAAREWHQDRIEVATAD